MFLWLFSYERELPVLSQLEIVVSRQLLVGLGRIGIAPVFWNSLVNFIWVFFNDWLVFQRRKKSNNWYITPDAWSRIKKTHHSSASSATHNGGKCYCLSLLTKCKDFYVLSLPLFPPCQAIIMCNSKRDIIPLVLAADFFMYLHWPCFWKPFSSPALTLLGVESFFFFFTCH